ncbi:MAG: hypothetical protein OMM_02660 [Candidatus Magnetoglobus multicellularis str. Araruama]|uniref:Vitellogenin domain-containing protein n=1 Tax=Candidatus Magnetoglobus multicellularis str. Araruama TaxID=890399 RepID=A0A1V1P8H4_9BACT|nr:MAG: hypothetical protein OMM_02660 [Candidatus Magnetoglobus multicellularis str. Araruama]
MNDTTQPKRSKKIFLVIAGLIIAGFGYHYWSQDDNDNFFKQKPFTKQHPRPMLTERHCPIKLNWYTGAKQMYHLDIVKTDLTYPSALEGQSIDKEHAYALQIHMEISATLNIRIFGKNAVADIIYFGCQLSNVNVRAGESPDDLSRDEDLETLFRPFFLIAMHKNGLPDQFYFPPHLDNQSRTSLSEIIFALQTVVPSDARPGQNKWRSNEQHAFGKFKVEYMLEPHSCQSLIKQNIRCTALHDLDHAMLRTDQFQFRGIIEQSNHQITLSAENASWIESYAGEETFAIFVSQHAVWYRRQTKILLTPDQQYLDPELFIWETTMPVSDIIDAFASHEEKKGGQTIQNSNRQSEGQPLSSRLEMFQKDILANVSQEVILEHIQRLKQFLSKFPEESGFIPDLIKNLNINANTAAQIILILEMIGHEEAQNAISDIFLDYNQLPEIRLKAVISAGGISTPKPDLLDSLFRLIAQEQDSLDNLAMNRSDAAILSLGLLNETFYKAKNSVSANFIHNRLIGLLERYSDERHVVACIKALGNATMPEGEKYLIPYINSETPFIRQSAIKALGRLDVPEKENTIHDNDDTLSENSDARSITDNVSVRLIYQYHQENDPEIRQDIIKSVVKRREPEAVHLLDDILQEETDDTILDLIQSYLESYLQLY